MGAGVFHGRVRDGIGCFNPAMATGPPDRILVLVCGWGSGVGAAWRGLALCAVGVGGPTPVRWCGDGSSYGRLGPLG